MTMLDLSAHFSRFRMASSRIHLAAHSHHYWPDVTREAQIAAWDDAATLADRKWGKVFGEVIPAVQRSIAETLSLPDPDSIAFAPNTHDFVRRLLSCLPADRPPRILTTDGEFHSFARQAARLEEDDLVVVERVAHEPVASFPARLQAAAAQGGHDLVFVSQILFNAGCASGEIAALASAVPDPATLVVIDGYHGFLAVPTDLSSVAGRVFYLSGGYKYAMGGENVCFIHCPPGYGARPRDTGWYAAFGALKAKAQGVGFGEDGSRFWGATMDASGLYRQRAVFDWMGELGLTVEAIHGHALALQELFLAGVDAHAIDALRQARLVTPRNTRMRGHFLTFETPRAQALHDALMEHDIIVDVRGDRLRFGFGIYQTQADIEGAVAAVAKALSAI
jgi:selenocysteine lyase/cysteine desulfurase